MGWKSLRAKVEELEDQLSVALDRLGAAQEQAYRDRGNRAIAQQLPALIAEIRSMRSELMGRLEAMEVDHRAHWKRQARELRVEASAAVKSFARYYVADMAAGGSAYGGFSNFVAARLADPSCMDFSLDDIRAEMHLDNVDGVPIECPVSDVLGRALDEV